MLSGLPRQVKKACERPPHAEWARPAGQLAFSETGSEGLAELCGDGREVRQGFRGGRLQDVLYFTRALGGLVMAEHAEVAGEFMGDGEGFEARGFVEGASGGLCGGAVEKIEALAQYGEIALPDVGEKSFDFAVGVFGHRMTRAEKR